MDEQQRQLADELLFTEKKKASFAKQLYFGRFASSLVFPFPELSPTQKLESSEYLAKIKQFAMKEIDPDWIDRHAEIPKSVLKGLAKIGMMGTGVPKEFGGLGLSQRTYCQAVEIIAGRCASTALLINAHQSIGLRALLLFGTPAQKKRWLKPMAQGEQIAAFSLTEPNAGSDAAGIETRAVYDAQKKCYRLNGRKQWTTSGSLAQVLTVMAKTEVDTPKGKQDKVTAFLVTPDMRGFKILDPALEKVGMRGTHTANLEFRDMEVPEENVLGPIGGGLKVCLTVLDYGRTTFGAMCTGAAKFLLEKAVSHVKTRYQFNRPLGSFGLVKKKIAKIAALTYAMESATYMTAGFIDQDVEDIMLESAILKVFASDALWTILYDTMQIYGGRSFFTDHPFERMMRDARLNMIGEGSNEVMLAFIGAVGMRDVGYQLKEFVDTLKSPIAQKKNFSKLFSQLWTHLLTPKITVTAPILRPVAKRLADDVREFGFAVAKLLAHYREDIVEKQLELERIAESAIALYTSTAVLSRLESEARDGKRIPDHDLEAGKLYCSMAHSHLRNQLSQLMSPLDQAIETCAQRYTGIKNI